MPLPNFLIIGAPKAGTTSLFDYVTQHPQVFGSAIKEAGHFVYDGAAREEGGVWRTGHAVQRSDYLDLFAGAEGAVARGEATPAYLFTAGVPERIYEAVPDMRLIAILRHPVDRAYSGYKMQWRLGTEDEPFERAIQLEPAQPLTDLRWDLSERKYMRIGYYHTHLKRFYTRFGAEQVRVFLYEELAEQPEAVLAEIYAFLEVDPSFTPDLSTKLNTANMPRLRWLNRMLKHPNTIRDTLSDIVPAGIRSWLRQRLITANTQAGDLPPLPADTRRDLTRRFEDDIHRLSDLIGRDLSHWM